MAHARQDIRTKVCQMLVAGATAAKDRVFPTRMDRFQKGELPAIAVYALEESVDPESRQNAPRWLRRSLQLAVVGVAMANDAVDNALDDLALDLERVMDGDRRLGGLCADSILATTEIAIDENLARPVGYVRLTYTVLYDTDVPAAVNLPLNDLVTVDSQTQVGSLAAPAEDVTTLPTGSTP